MIYSGQRLRVKAILTIFFIMGIVLLQSASAQRPETPKPTLKFGDMAPALMTSEWYKGAPVTSFEKGQIYVIEFWATWCQPCRAAMPRLSAIAKKYRNKITVIGVDVFETPRSTPEKVRKFVDSMGNKMNYRVAADDQQYMEKKWSLAAGDGGIPDAYIIDGDGRLAWFGHPKYLHKVLPKVVNKEWNIEKELSLNIERERLKQLDDTLSDDLIKYNPGFLVPQDNYGKPDSMLLAIDAIVAKEPSLKYAMKLGLKKMGALLRLDAKQANKFGREMLESGREEAEDFRWLAAFYSLEHNTSFMTPDSYAVGADAYQKMIDHLAYPEISDVSVYYTRMAEWYGLARNKEKEIQAHKKAIRYLKQKGKGRIKLSTAPERSI